MSELTSVTTFGDDRSMSDGLAVLADRVFDGRRWRDKAAVLVRDGAVVGLSAWSEVPASWAQQRIPAGAMLVPGFIDLQVNGGAGVLLNNEPTVDGMRAIAKAHRRYGTTSCLPTLITDTPDKMRAAVEAARTISGQDGVLGLHLEGPFINPQRPGVHRVDRIARPDAEALEFLCLLSTIGQSLVTLAPECVPAGFIRSLALAGVHVSIGHSEATAADVAQAVSDGATGVTHLFNAMSSLSARSPGIVGATLAEPRLTAGLILDGIHVDPVSVRAAFSAKGADRIAFVTDAMPTVGSTLDHFELQGRQVQLLDGRLATEAGTLAGAHLDMASAVRNAVKLAHLPLEDALRAASLTPAQFLGLERQVGAIIPGARADLVALDGELKVIAVWLSGAVDLETSAVSDLH